MTDYLSNDIIGIIGEEIKNINDTKQNKKNFNIVIKTIKEIGDWAIEVSDDEEDIHDSLNWVLESRKFNVMMYFQDRPISF